MYSRRFKESVLRRIEVLEKKYQVQEQQVKNLLQLIKEYSDELDRRHKAYNNLLLQVRNVTLISAALLISGFYVSDIAL